MDNNCDKLIPVRLCKVVGAYQRRKILYDWIYTTKKQLIQEDPLRRMMKTTMTTQLRATTTGFSTKTNKQIERNSACKYKEINTVFISSIVYCENSEIYIYKFGLEKLVDDRSIRPSKDRGRCKAGARRTMTTENQREEQRKTKHGHFMGRFSNLKADRSRRK